MKINKYLQKIHAKQNTARNVHCTQALIYLLDIYSFMQA